MRLSKINRVALYCSELNFCEISIEEQMEKLKKYCKHFDLEIVGEYIDIKDDKCNFNQMIEDIKNKEFNIIVSYSFDTLSKKDDDLHKLINELDKYNYELHLENTYEYVPILKPLFKSQIYDDAYNTPSQIPIKKKKSGLMPMFITYELKNPKTKEPIDWVKKFDEDNVRFENNELFNDDGEYLGFARDVYVKFKEFKGCYKPKKKDEKNKKNKEQLNFKPLW